MGSHSTHGGLSMGSCHGNCIGFTGYYPENLGTLVYGISVVPEEVKEYALPGYRRGVDYQHPVIPGRLRKQHGKRVNAVFIGYDAPLLRESIGKLAPGTVIPADDVIL